jgi:hypothetical protein
MGAVKIFVCLVCLAFIGRGGVFDGDGVEGGEGSSERIIAIARKELGVREQTGHNDGARVEEYLKCVGLKKGDKWCAAYISWVFAKAGYAEPRTGWSPALFPANKTVKEPKPGMVMGIWFPSLNRIAHCGLVEGLRNDWVTCLEGNSNLEGSREGDGVWRRIWHKRTISRYADWITTKN